MELYEIINFFLNKKKLSKKEFAEKLISLEPKLKNTGEIPSINTIYAYLNGRIGIKAELIPYIADVLDIPEQFFFELSDKKRAVLLEHLLSSLSQKEQKTILKNAHLLFNDNSESIQCKEIGEVSQLLIYASKPLLLELKNILLRHKEKYESFKKNFSE
jgi:transcriptional regulator with XRE-family HTH domain